MESIPHRPAVAGRVRKDLGMSAAAAARRPHVARAQIRFLDSLLADPTRTTTTDSCTEDLAAAYSDGGRWMGTVPLALCRAGLIERIGYRPSERASRHATPVSVWRAIVTDAALQAYRDALFSALVEAPPASAAVPTPPRPAPTRQGTLFNNDAAVLPD